MAAELLLPTARASDTNNSPYSGAQWFFYESGTSTPQAAYADADLTTSLGSTVTADSAGKFVPIYFDARLSYRGVLKNATGSVTIHDIDPINQSALAAAIAEIGNLGVSATLYGVSASASGSENKAALQDAIDDIGIGGRLYLPPAATPYLFDTSGGLSSAILIDKSIEIIVNGDIQASTGNFTANPPYIFKVTADNVTISGGGRILGSGAINDANIGPYTSFPGLIWCEGDNFTMRGVELVDPPKVGLMLYQCERALITECRFTGGPTVYTDTAHFAIRTREGGGHTFSNNRFYPSPTGGMCVQGIFMEATNDCLFEGNHAQSPYEKLIYAFGDRNTAIGNVIKGWPSFVPGTNIEGTITLVIRFHGTNNQVIANRSYRCAGGAQMMDGTGHVVENNVFLSCGQTGISVFNSNLTGSKVRNNRVTRNPLSGALAGDGIRCASNTAATKLIVEGNDVDGFSVADPLVEVVEWDATTAYGINSIVKPSVGNGRYYSATTGGTTAAVEPTWPTTPGATVTDGTVVWTAVAFEAGQSEIKVIGLDLANPIATSSIRNNTTSGGQYGIVLNYVTTSQITGNQCTATVFGLSEGLTAGLCASNNWRFNDVTGTVPTVQNLAPTSITFDYTQGSFAPTLGPAVSTTGAVTSTARWTRIGRRVELDMTFSATTISVAAGGGEILSNLPAAIAGAVNSMGGLGTDATPLTPGATYYSAATPTKLYGSALSGGTRLDISIGFTL